MTTSSDAIGSVRIFRLSVLTIFCLIFPFSTALSYNRIDALQALQSVENSWADLNMDVWINSMRGDASPGVFISDNVRFSVQSSAPAYFLIVLVDAKGETTVINSSIFGPAATKVDYPSNGDILQQAAPVGEQNVIVFASDAPFSMPSMGLSEEFDTVDSSISALKKLASDLSQIGRSHRLAVAARYKYFVDSSDNKTGTRGLRKEVGKQKEEVEEKQADSSALSLDVKFQYNSSELGEEGMTQLDVLGSELVSLLEAESLPRISTEGHPDDIGPAAYNMSLSDRRAKAARDYLLNTFDLPQSSIEAFGKGESHPVGDNISRAARAINRRVELRVLR